MEIEIQTKTNNPLLKRTEVRFIIHHDNESTPKRELVRNELAEKLNVKKENIMVNMMHSTFGKSETIGYAKVYTTLTEAQETEPDHILKRNHAYIEKKKPKKEGETTPEKPAAPPQPSPKPETQKPETPPPETPKTEKPKEGA